MSTGPAWPMRRVSVLAPVPTPEMVVNSLARRLTWLERQHRMLLTALADDQRNGGRALPVCMVGPCRNSGPGDVVPHMAELPFGCPDLGRSDPGPCTGPGCDHVSHAEPAAEVRQGVIGVGRVDLLERVGEIFFRASRTDRRLFDDGAAGRWIVTALFATPDSLRELDAELARLEAP